MTNKEYGIHLARIFYKDYPNLKVFPFPLNEEQKNSFYKEWNKLSKTKKV